jgi:hypothetical protein
VNLTAFEGPLAAFSWASLLHLRCCIPAGPSCTEVARHWRRTICLEAAGPRDTKRMAELGMLAMAGEINTSREYSASPGACSLKLEAFSLQSHRLPHCDGMRSPGMATISRPCCLPHILRNQASRSNRDWPKLLQTSRHPDIQTSSITTKRKDDFNSSVHVLKPLLTIFRNQSLEAKAKLFRQAIQRATRRKSRQ